MKPVLYIHGGSGNHGCEAIARTLIEKLHESGVKEHLILSANINEDKKNDLTSIATIQPLSTNTQRCSLKFIHAYLMNKILGRHIYLDMLPREKQIKSFKDYDVAIAIGGDTYSYKYSDDNTYTHNLFRKQGMKTILWGCSINPSLMNDRRVLADLQNFDMITARESITYQALKAHGISNVWLFPDLAFSLQRKECEESKKIRPQKTVGINMSPLVQNYQSKQNMVIDNYRRMIEYLLHYTDYDIALVPHVTWSHNDDRKAMQPLYEEFKESGRIVQIGDHNCMELKDIIARCHLFVCARTHASIAAYSSCVPTLVLGYSVKARGIAKDIFGTDENLVIPAQSLTNPDEMTEALQWLMGHEKSLRTHLLKVMPKYISRTSDSQEAFKTL